MNQFLSQVTKKDTTTANGAVSNSSTGSTLVDQFGVAGAQRGRPLDAVFADQSKLEHTYPMWALRFVFYLRIITRKVRYQDKVTESVQKGTGNRDESFKRLLWYAVNNPDKFYRNLWLLPIVGSYKDIFDLLYLAEQNSIKLDVAKVMSYSNITNHNGNMDLIRKYLPTVKANSKVKSDRAKYRNVIAKRIASIMNMGYDDLRKFKSEGTAHEWQKLISRRLFNVIDFNKISGKALSKLVNGKFIKNHKLEDKYTSWIAAQPVAKFTGYVYELYEKVKVNNKPFVKMTIDKQFEGLLKLNQGGLGKRKVISAIDTSSSMETSVQGGKTTCMSVAISLGVYFSSLMEGPFKDWVIRFTSRSHWAQLKGTFSDKCIQVKNFGDYPSNTDFQSVIDSIVRVRIEKPDVPESDFPDTLLVVSDMQFDITGPKTNYEAAQQKLSGVFSKEYVDNFMFIWWQVNGRMNDKPQTLDEPGGYVIGGFDGATVSLIISGSEKKEDGTTPNMQEVVESALSQEILTWVD